MSGSPGERSSGGYGRVPRWLAWARELQALGQTGLAYTESPYDRQRYQRLLTVAAEMAAAETGLDEGELLAGMSTQAGYATPKVDVRAAVVHEGRILLVQERSDGRWAMPGGWADVGDGPSAAAEREVREESGCIVRARRLVGVYDANNNPERPRSLYHAFKLVFLCDCLGGEPSPSEETLAAAFFAFGALPPLSPNRTAERHLADVAAALADPALPTVFD